MGGGLVVGWGVMVCKPILVFIFAQSIEADNDKHCHCLRKEKIFDFWKKKAKYVIL